MSPPIKKAWFDQHMTKFAAELADEYAPATIESHVHRVKALLRTVHGPSGRLDRMQRRYAGYAPKMRSLAAFSWRLYQDHGGIPIGTLDPWTPLPPGVARAVYLIGGQIGLSAVRRLRWADVDESGDVVTLHHRGRRLDLPGFALLLPAMRAWAFASGPASPGAPLIPASEGASSARALDLLALDAERGAAVTVEQMEPARAADHQAAAQTRPARARGLPRDAVLALRQVLEGSRVPASALPKLTVSDFVHRPTDGALLHVRNPAHGPSERRQGQPQHFDLRAPDAADHFRRYLAFMYPDGCPASALAVPNCVNGTSPCSATQARAIRSLNITKA